MIFKVLFGFIVCSIATSNGLSIDRIVFPDEISKEYIVDRVPENGLAVDRIVFPDEISKECIVDRVPENGWMELKNQFIAQSDRHSEVNDRVPSLTLALYKCHEGYHNFGAANNFCYEGQWRSEVPDCERFCQLNHAIPEEDWSKVVCSRDAIEIPCTERVQIGTQLIATNEHNESVKKVCNILAEWDDSSNYDEENQMILLCILGFVLIIL